MNKIVIGDGLIRSVIKHTPGATEKKVDFGDVRNRVRRFLDDPDECPPDVVLTDARSLVRAAVINIVSQHSGRNFTPKKGQYVDRRQLDSDHARSVSNG